METGTDQPASTVPEYLDPSSNNGDLRPDAEFRRGWNACREAMLASGIGSQVTVPEAAIQKLRAAQACHPNAVQPLIAEGLELLLATENESRRQQCK